METIQTILNIGRQEAFTQEGPLLPFDIVNKILSHYIQENYLQVLETYHLIRCRFSTYERELLVIECFKKINDEKVFIPNYEESEETESEDKNGDENFEYLDEGIDFFNSLIDYIIHLEKEQIIKNFCIMIFDIQNLLIHENVRRLIFSHDSLNRLSTRLKLFPFEIIKLLYKHEVDSKCINLIGIYFICKASRIEIQQWIKDEKENLFFFDVLDLLEE